MKQQLKNLTLFIAVAAGMGAALAATPTAKTSVAAPSTAKNPTKGGAELYPAGTLTKLSVGGDHEALVNGKPVLVQFAVTGSCRIDLDPGDGGAIVRYESDASDGLASDKQMIVNRGYTFNTTFSSASETYKPVTMVFKAISPCVNKVPLEKMAVKVKVTPELQSSIRSGAIGAKASVSAASSPAPIK